MSIQTPEIQGEHEMLELLRQPAEDLLNRHLSVAKEWFPHELTPWSDGQTFTEEEIKAGRAGEGIPPVTSKAAGSALLVNLLTEDNLPFYYETINRLAPSDHPFSVWTRRWTAEEGRHSLAIRDYVLTRRLLDPWALERARMVQVSGGEVPQPKTVADGLMYTTLQEQATQIAHRNTGRLLDATGRKVMGRVAGDEGLHYNFYHDLASAVFEERPSVAVLALSRQVIGFAMPGTGIPDFDTHKKIIADADIYDLHHFVDDVARPNIESWNVENLKGLSSEAEIARDALYKHITKLERVANRRVQRRAESQAAERVNG